MGFCGILGCPAPAHSAFTLADPPFSIKICVKHHKVIYMAIAELVIDYAREKAEPFGGSVA